MLKSKLYQALLPFDEKWGENENRSFALDTKFHVCISCLLWNSIIYYIIYHLSENCKRFSEKSSEREKKTPHQPEGGAENAKNDCRVQYVLFQISIRRRTR